MKLKELGDYFIGLTYKPDEVSDDGVIVLRSSNIQNGKFDLSDIVRVKTTIRDKLFVKPGDILMCSRNGSARLVGKSTVIPEINEKMTFGAFMTIFRTPYNDYLRFFLQSKNFRNQLIGSKTTTINQITIRMLDNIDIDLPDSSVRFERCKKLASLQHIIELREQELQKMDELIKARFVEMFGNPVKNTMGWETKPLGSLATKIGSGATPKGGKESYREDGISLIRSMNVRNAEFDYKDLAHISDEQASKLDNVIIEENDVLLNITGASVARSCIAPYDVLPARVNQHVCIIRCRNYIDPIFLNRLLTDDNYQDLLWGIAGSGATREAITKQQVESLTIITPLRELQESFAQFVAQVDKSKVVIQKSLNETQVLFDSLMQEYFG